MSQTRREFLEMSVTTAAAAVIGPVAFGQQAAQPAGAAATGKSILILGGTGFLGPATVAAAQARGLKITLFNRGKTRPGLFPDLEKLHGDRDPAKGEGLKALEGRKWDAVIDNSGYYPRHVKASAELLAPNCGQYIYISSISAYASSEKEGADETAPLGTMADPNVEEMGAGYENYGPLKVLCEQAAQKAFGDRACVIRPGYIVGPDDPTDRFTYWPVRADRGGEMIAPGTPDDPVQFIDVRDLGEWVVTCVEKKVAGAFNAIGPEKSLKWGQLLDACAKTANNGVKMTWVPSEFLNENGCPTGTLPIWLPPTGEFKGFHTWKSDRARAAGLKFRTAEDTVAATLKWWKEQPEERRAKMRMGLPAEKEAEILKNWREKK